MSFQGWLVFATFWAVFVTTPGPNAVNCVTNGMTLGFARSLPAVAAILCQAALFLALSAVGVTALLAASPGAFRAVQLVGAAVLVGLGVRGWVTAGRPVVATPDPARVFGRAFAIATINAKSVAGYLAAFSQFVEPGVPLGRQMGAIVPTALTLTAASYTTYTALGAGLGRAALGALANLWLRRGMASLLVAYGVALALWTPGRAG